MNEWKINYNILKCVYKLEERKKVYPSIIIDALIFFIVHFVETKKKKIIHYYCIKKSQNL